MRTSASKTIKDIRTVIDWICDGYYKGTQVAEATKVSKVTIYALVAQRKKTEAKYNDLDLENMTLKTAKSLCAFYERHKGDVRRLKNGK